jgi:hypothetical protein
LATYTNIPSSATSLNRASYVNIPTSSTFLPSDVTGLELWLDGRDLVGVDGAAISTWAKRGGTSGIDAAQATGARQPIVKSGANGLNNLPVARFDGTDDFMLSTLNAGAAGFTIYIVGRTGGALTNYGSVVGSGGSVTFDNPTASIAWSFSRGNAVDTFGAGWGGPTANVALGDVAGIAINQSFYARYRTNKIAWSIDGPNSGTPADTSFPTATFQTYVGAYGVNAGTTNTPFNGDVAAVLIYSVAVSAPNDALIKAYLQTLWGV